MKTIDVRGKLCPEPLIITKKAIKAGQQGDSFAVLLDNDVASCNLENYLREMGVEYNTTKQEEIFTIHFTLGGAPLKNVAVEDFCTIPTGRIGDYVVVLSSAGMGQDKDGSMTLGKILMRGCINSLSQQDVLPKAIIMYNSGVLVAMEGADTVPALKELAAEGVDLLLCGVCVDYYDMKPQIAVGRISNMLEITTITSRAHHVLYP